MAPMGQNPISKYEIKRHHAKPDTTNERMVIRQSHYGHTNPAVQWKINARQHDRPQKPADMLQAFLASCWEVISGFGINLGGDRMIPG